MTCHQWFPPGDPRHDATGTPVITPPRKVVWAGDIIGLARDTDPSFYLRLVAGDSPTWKKLAPGDWVVRHADGRVEWWPDRRMQETLNPKETNGQQA